MVVDDSDDEELDEDGDGVLLVLFEHLLGEVVGVCGFKGGIRGVYGVGDC